ncbi:MAG: polymer-forming cytoskeletal protein [bacterium]
MFKKDKSGGNVNTKDVETIIGSSVKVEGDFVCQGNMVIDGEVKGNVKTHGMLRIGEKAMIIAGIGASSAKISGQVRGNVKVDDYLEITRSAKIFGDIEASRLSVAEGALLNGRCTMVIKEGKQARAKIAAEKEEAELEAVEEK